MLIRYGGPVDLRGLFELQSHGADTFVGVGPVYPWGGLYGGQIVAQALRAATMTVEDGLQPHSLRAYFIRRGDSTEPIRFEVDRIRNGDTFATRRVVSRQSTGAILNLEASFQRAEDSLTLQTVPMAEGVPAPESLDDSSWSETFRRCSVPASSMGGPPRTGIGRTGAWMKVTDELDDDQLVHRCWLAYLSDDLPTDSVIQAHPEAGALGDNVMQRFFAASLDHAIWFHRPMRADRWHFYDVSCHHFVSGRGLAVGHVFDADGSHVATIAQETLLRERRSSR